GLGTFAVDAGHRLYVDFDQVRGWGAVACSEVLLHEVGHLFADHAGQAEEFGIDPTQRRTWNAAADMSLNDDLVQAGCDYIAQTGLLPSAVGADDFQTAKHYFDAIKALQDQQQDSGDGSGNGSGGGEGSGSGDGDSRPGEASPTSSQNNGDGEDGTGEPGDDSGPTNGQGESQPDSDDATDSGAGDGPFTGCGSASG